MNVFYKIFFSLLLFFFISPTFFYSQSIGLPWEYHFDNYIIKNIGFGNYRIKNAKVKILRLRGYKINNNILEEIKKSFNEFEFDENGRMLMLNSDNQDSSFIFDQKLIFILNDKGQHIEKNQYAHYFGSQMKIRTVFNYSNGIINKIDEYWILEDSSSKKPNELLWKETNYSKTGDEFTITESSGTGANTQKLTKVKIDKIGNPIEIVNVDKVDKLELPRDNNIIKYDKNGLILKTEGGDYKSEYIYNGDNSLHEVTIFFKDKLFLNVKIDYVQLNGCKLPFSLNIYNDSKNLISKTIYEYEFFK